MHRVAHLLDHDGAILRLIAPLTASASHSLVTSFAVDSQVPPQTLDALGSCRADDVLTVLHATGRSLPFYSAVRAMASLPPNHFIFMHVTASYLEAAGRQPELNWLRSVSPRRSRPRVLTPSQEVTRLYAARGIESRWVQLGISDPGAAPVAPQERVLISTTCTGKESHYLQAKGIDCFVDLVTRLNLSRAAIILGHDGAPLYGIRRMLAGPLECHSVIARSRVYVQLSRSESYNITAIEAKRLGVPVVVTDIEGHRDNIRHGVRVARPSDAYDIVRALWDDASHHDDIVNANYHDSISREIPSVFRKSLEDAVLD